ncbi:MAG: glycoside hydrolase family 2 protein [Clostridia bacterium]|nr:glycoside hydrolase family 2 protein [Clostridia bacterium]
MKKSLNGEWQFRQAGKAQWYKAHVPGCNFTDLADNGLISDPFYGVNEKDCAFVGKSDWEYRRFFQVDSEELNCDEVLLCFEMLDTLSDIRINGTLVGSTENCFLKYEFPVGSLLHAGENEISVYFHSPVNFVSETYRKEGGTVNSNGQNGIIHIRKPQSHFGWDWGPVLVPSGISGACFLEFVHTARLGLVSTCQQHHESGAVTLRVNTEIQHFSTQPVTTAVHITCPGGEELRANGTQAEFEIENPLLWWTYELSGKEVQPLYKVSVTLKEGERVVDEKELDIGLRTIKLNREADAYGQQFCFELNGVPLFAKGANVIPPDQFIHRFDEEKREKFFAAVRFANMNLLRIWGGGYYADDAFLKKCDEMGILVWQDFQFACQAYPFFKKSFLENVKREVAQNVARICSHPCLALWSGNNEIEQMSTAWQHKRDYVEWTDTFFYTILEKQIRKIDKATSYIPGSPCGTAYNTGINQDNVGDSHIWAVWHGMQPMTYYRKRFPRFCSEFGFESLPDLKTIQTFAAKADYDLQSPVFLSHQKCGSGNSKMLYYIATRFHLPQRFEDYVYLSQLAQMECVEDATLHWRRHRGRCNGSLYWQFNDCWPVCSWAGMDYYYNYKALHYAARRFNAPVCISAEDSREQIELFAHNDTNEEVALTMEAFFFSFTGEKKKGVHKKITLPALAVKKVLRVNTAHIPKAKKSCTGLCVRIYRESGEMLMQKVILPDKEKNLALPKVRIKKESVIKDRSITLKLKADKFARLVCLTSEVSGAAFSDNFFDLLPGQTYEVSMAVPAGEDAQALAAGIGVFSLSDIAFERSAAKTIKNKIALFCSPTNLGNIIFHAPVPKDLEL